jgi:hypothetical protein
MQSAMKTRHKRRKVRLYGKEQPRFPKPRSAKRDKGFSLKTINNADCRFAVVKQMRKRLDQLMDDAGVDTVSKEWLAARAVFLVGYLESLEVDAFEGKEIDWKRYMQAVKSLSDVLSKLGLDRAAKSAARLHDYLNGNGSRRKRDSAPARKVNCCYRRWNAHG